jgi:hypothetical protein
MTYKEVFQSAQDKGYKLYHKPAFLWTKEGEEHLIRDIEPQLELTLIQKWLREKHNISMWAFQEKRLDAGFVVYIDGKLKAHNHGRLRTYEDAMLEGIYESLKLIHND